VEELKIHSTTRKAPTQRRRMENLPLWHFAYLWAMWIEWRWAGLQHTSYMECDWHSLLPFKQRTDLLVRTCD
jgi:hypothetical protein